MAAFIQTLPMLDGDLPFSIHMVSYVMLTMGNLHDVTPRQGNSGSWQLVLVDLVEIRRGYKGQ